MSYKSALAMIRTLNTMAEDEKKAFAVLNKGASAETALSELRHACYSVDKLSVAHLKAFRKELKSMSASELEFVEQINDKSLSEIQKYLDDKINAYNEEARQLRAFKARWTLREKDLLQQLVNEGAITLKGNGTYYECEAHTIAKRLLDGKVALAKEMGLHLDFYDPFAGRASS